MRLDPPPKPGSSVHTHSDDIFLSNDTGAVHPLGPTGIQGSKKESKEQLARLQKVARDRDGAFFSVVRRPWAPLGKFSRNASRFAHLVLPRETMRDVRPGIAIASVSAAIALVACGKSSGSRPITSTTSPASSTTTTGLPPPATTSTVAPLFPPSGTGAYGLVTAGPSCPVATAAHPCPPHPLSLQIQAHSPAGVTVASTRSDAHGRYVLDLPAGTYTLVFITPSGWPHCPNTTVAVRSNIPTRADVSCDTGIR